MGLFNRKRIVLTVSAEAYDEIAGALRALHWDTQDATGDIIDMRDVDIKRGKPTAKGDEALARHYARRLSG